MALNKKNVLKAMEILREIYVRPARDKAYSEWLDRENEEEFSFSPEHISTTSFPFVSPEATGIIFRDGKTGDGYESVCIQIKDITGDQIKEFFDRQNEIHNSCFISTPADLETKEGNYSVPGAIEKNITRIGWF